jgi:hypothetical protein
MYAVDPVCGADPRQIFDTVTTGVPEPAELTILGVSIVTIWLKATAPRDYLRAFGILL